MTAAVTGTSGVDGGLQEVLARIATIQNTISTIQSTISGKTNPLTSSSFASTLSSLSDSSAAATTSAATPINPTGTVNGVTYLAAAANVTGDDVVETAKSYLGVPYVYAGNDKNGIDCSGLVQQTYKALGMDVPRVSWDQQKVGTEVAGGLANAKPGDVLAFGEPSYHVAIYLGDNKMIEAPKPGEKVQISNVWATPSHIRRIVGDSSATAATATATDASAMSGASSVSSVAGSASVSSSVASYSALFSAAEKRYNLPTGLLAAVAQVESGGNASAVSPAGAQGLMQLMPGTAGSLGVDPLNPTQAVDGAARMLQGLLAKYKDSTTLALAAYNAGPGAVDKYNGVPPYQETQNYVVKVQNLMPSAA